MEHPLFLYSYPQQRGLIRIIVCKKRREIDVIDLPKAQYLMFQGEPFEEEEYCQTIDAVQQAINNYNPSVIGYQWDEENPKIQMEPVGTRGYIN